MLTARLPSTQRLLLKLLFIVQWLCEPPAHCLPWAPVWHVRVLSGRCCPCCLPPPPASASSCPTGCWGRRWTSPCPLAPSAAAPTRWGTRRGRPRWCWSSAGATPPSTASRAWSGGSARWWRAWGAASSCWWRSRLSWAAASLTSSHVRLDAWPAASSLLEVSCCVVLFRVCTCSHPGTPPSRCGQRAHHVLSHHIILNVFALHGEKTTDIDVENWQVSRAVINS